MHGDIKDLMNVSILTLYTGIYGIIFLFAYIFRDKYAQHYARFTWLFAFSYMVFGYILLYFGILHRDIPLEQIIIPLIIIMVFPLFCGSAKYDPISKGDSESAKLVRELDSYINLPQKQVTGAFLIEGAWGSGKSFFIQKHYMPQRKKLKIHYISLYGKDQLEDLNKDTWYKHLLWISITITALIPVVFALFHHKISNPISNSLAIFGSLLALITFIIPFTTWLYRDKLSFLRYKTIIIDDLERKSEELSLKTVFGFIDQAIRHGCKVIVIANMNESEQQGEKATIRYHERAFQRKYLFEPSTDDHFKIIQNMYGNITWFEDSKDTIFTAYDEYGKKNIRILQQACDGWSRIDELSRGDYLDKNKMLYDYFTLFFAYYNDFINKDIFKERAENLELMASFYSSDKKNVNDSSDKEREKNLEFMNRTEIRHFRLWGNIILHHQYSTFEPENLALFYPSSLLTNIKKSSQSEYEEQYHTVVRKIENFDPLPFDFLIYYANILLFLCKYDERNIGTREDIIIKFKSYIDHMTTNDTIFNYQNTKNRQNLDLWLKGKDPLLNRPKPAIYIESIGSLIDKSDGMDEILNLLKDVIFPEMNYTPIEAFRALLQACHQGERERAEDIWTLVPLETYREKICQAHSENLEEYLINITEIISAKEIAKLAIKLETERNFFLIKDYFNRIDGCIAFPDEWKKEVHRHLKVIYEKTNDIPEKIRTDILLSEFFKEGKQETTDNSTISTEA